MFRELILKHTDNLNGTLQHECMSATEGQKIAQMTTDTLKLLKNDESFDICCSLSKFTKFPTRNALKSNNYL